MFEIGQKVRFTSAREHKKMSWCYPPAGWIGKILRVPMMVQLWWIGAKIAVLIKMSTATRGGQLFASWRK